MGLRFIGFMVVALLIAAGVAWVVNNVSFGRADNDVNKEEDK